MRLISLSVALAALAAASATRADLDVPSHSSALRGRDAHASSRMVTVPTSSSSSTADSSSARRRAAAQSFQERAAAAAGGDALLQVKTTSGVYSGSYDASLGLYHYFGMRYAEDTSGGRRFTASRRKAFDAASNASPLDATKFGPSCPQWVSSTTKLGLSNVAQYLPDLEQAEDCLSVNVWVSKAVRQKAAQGVADAPILIYFHGGSYTAGSSAYKLYNLDAFASANPDIVAISFNYRLNIFGFPAAPQLKNGPTSQNFGLLDQELMLGWVRDNAHLFGGDRNRIVLQGQSAGATSVDQWAYVHSGQDGLPSTAGTGVVGIVSESGVTNGLDVVLSQSSAPGLAWGGVSLIVGCGIVTNADQLKCMRSKPWQQLIGALDTLQPLTVGPLYDGKTWFNDFNARARRGALAKTPTFIGNNADEGYIYLALTTQLAQNPPVPLGQLVTNAIWRCPAVVSTAARRKVQAPTWRYEYYGVWQDTTCNIPRLGAFHGSELSVVFGRYGGGDICQKPPGVTPPAELATGKLFRDAIAAFTRDPNQGLTKFGWPQVGDDNTPTLGRISYANSGKLDFVTPASVNKPCNSPNDLGQEIVTLMRKASGLT